MINIEVNYLDTRKKENFFVEKTSFTIGRSSKADVVIKREELSRFHIQIDRLDDNFFITDLNSSNGIFVNGNKIQAGIKTPHQIIFPIEIAFNISITILIDEKLDFQRSTRESKVKKTKNKFESRTVNVDKYRTHDIRFKIIVIFFAAFIGGLTTYYFRLPEANENNSNVAQVNQSKKTQVNFKTLMKENHCSKFNELCSDLDPISSNLILNMNPEGLIIFYDLTQKKIENSHPNFQKLPEKIKHQVYLSEIGTRNKLLMFAKENNAKKLLIIGFVKSDSQIYLKYLLDLDYQTLVKIPVNLTLLHKDLYFDGIKRLYLKNIQPNIYFTLIE